MYAILTVFLLEIKKNCAVVYKKGVSFGSLQGNEQTHCLNAIRMKYLINIKFNNLCTIMYI